MKEIKMKALDEEWDNLSDSGMAKMKRVEEKLEAFSDQLLTKSNRNIIINFQIKLFISSNQRETR